MPHYEVSERHRAEWESLRGLGRDGLFGPSAGLWEQAAVLVGGGAVVLEMRVKRKSWILGGTELTATDSLESHDFCHSDVREVFVPIPADAAVDDVVVNIRLVSGVLSLYFSLSLSLSLSPLMHRTRCMGGGVFDCKAQGFAERGNKQRPAIFWPEGPGRPGLAWAVGGGAGMWGGREGRAAMWHGTAVPCWWS